MPDPLVLALPAAALLGAAALWTYARWRTLAEALHRAGTLLGSVALLLDPQDMDRLAALAFKARSEELGPADQESLRRLVARYTPSAKERPVDALLEAAQALLEVADLARPERPDAS